MALYNMDLLEDGTLKIGFGDAASNDQIVKEVSETVKEIKKQCHGKIVKLNGPASLPVAVILGHELAHVTAAVAVYDPKLGKYVVCISHGNPSAKVGDLID